MQTGKQNQGHATSSSHAPALPGYWAAKGDNLGKTLQVKRNQRIASSADAWLQQPRTAKSGHRDFATYNDCPHCNRRCGTASCFSMTCARGCLAQGEYTSPVRGWLQQDEFREFSKSLSKSALLMISSVKRTPALYYGEASAARPRTRSLICQAA